MLGMVHQEHAADFLFRSVEVCTNASVKCKELADGRGKMVTLFLELDRVEVALKLF